MATDDTAIAAIDAADPGATGQKPGLRRAIIGASLLAISLLALWLRWQRLDLMEFTNDQAWVLNQAIQFTQDGRLPLRGVTTSMGAIQGPWETYLLTLPALFSHDPLIATAFVGLLQTAAIVGTYFLGRRYFGVRAGFSAALLFAVNPWAVHYARKIWTPDWLPIFSLLLIACLAGLLAERKRWLAAIAMPCLTIMFLIHPSAALFGPVVVIVLLIRWRDVLWLPVLSGTALSLLAATPYLVYESTRNFYSFARYLDTSSGASGLNPEPLSILQSLTSARYFPAMMGYAFRGEWALPTLTWQDLLAQLLLLAGALTVAYLTFRQRRYKDAAGAGLGIVLLLWLALPVGLSMRNTMVMNPHYFIGLYPAPFLLMGLALSTLITLPARYVTAQRPRWLPELVTAAVLAFIALPQLQLMLSYLDLVEKNGPTRLYGVPYKYTAQAAETVNVFTRSNPHVPIYVISNQQRDVFNLLLRDVPSARVFDPPDGFVLPANSADGAAYLVTSDDGNTVVNEYQALADDSPFARRAGLSLEPGSLQARVDGPDGHSYFRLYRLSPQAITERLDSFSPPPQRATLENGMELLGVKQQTEAAAQELVTAEYLWAVPDAHPTLIDQEHNVFVHLTDKTGAEIAQNDQSMPSYRVWRSTDRMLTRHEVGLPSHWNAGTLWYDLGIYRRYERTGVNWLAGPQGQPTAALKTATLAVHPANEPLSAPPACERRFGDAICLLDASVDELTPGAAELTVSLRWLTRSALATDYTVSLQLLNGAGVLVAQHDGQPVNGNYPFSLWQPLRPVLDERTLSLKQPLPTGEYRLLLVVYNATDNIRLPAAGFGQDGTDYAELRTWPLQ